MALQTKVITANGSNGHHKFTMTVTENSINEDNNTSSVSYSLVLSPIQTGWDWSGWGTSIQYSVNVNGTVASGSIPSYNGSSTVTLASGTIDITHDENGEKTITFGFTITDTTGQSYTCGNASGSRNMTLTLIDVGIFRIGVNNSWKKATAYIGVNGVWKKCKTYIGVNGSWKKGV